MVTLSRAELDRLLEMRFYGLNSEGIGGRIRQELEDFIVLEISFDGVRASSRCSEIPLGAGDFTWIVVEKRGVDSISAVRRIQRFLGIKKNSISFAGLKDTSAVTFQFVSVSGRIPPEKIEEFNKVNTRVKLYCPVYRPFPLRPGLLFGNEFTVRVREAETSLLERLLQELGEVRGIPNYVGYQRFGSIRPVTHIVGKNIIQGKFKEAIEELLLKIFPNESEIAKKAREYLASTGDYKETLEIFPKSMKSERAVIAHLAEKPNDYVGALRSISSYIRKLYVGAYQAYLFNKVLSRRIEEGLSWIYPSVGDYVGILPSASHFEHTSVLIANDTNLAKLQRLIEEEKAVLLIPIFGYNTNLSQGRQGEIERNVLKEEGIDISRFYVKSIPEASSAGTYRPASLIPLKLNYNILGRDVVFSFILRKGMYATTLLREFIKPENPVIQGF
ncbi:MAG: tRNA pseudouridine(13) synthase TruD [Infirmifilum sp.]